MKVVPALCIFVLSVLCVGCLADTSGESPPSDQLIYPVGLAVTGNDDYLLVVNSNFDLMYNAGTFVAISLNDLDEIRKSGGSSDWKSPGGDFLYVPETELIDTKDTIRLAAFASDLELTPNRNRALIPVRGGSERHILVVDVDETAENGLVLSCGQGSDLRCDSDHRVTGNDDVTLPLEPYEVTSLNYTRQVPDGDKTVTLTDTFGFASHLYSGAVSAFLIENSHGELDAKLLDVVTGVTGEAGGIAANSRNNEIYVSGRDNPSQYLAVLQVLAGGFGGTYTNEAYFGMTGKVSYSGDLLGGTDTRSIAVSSDGKTAYVVSRTPEALLQVDVASRKMVDWATVGAAPSVLGIFEDEEYGAYAFVLCFKSNQVFIVELDTMQTAHVVPVGSGPQAVAFDKKRKLAYIANFRESTISIIQAVPPFDFVRTADGDTKLMIGKPRLPDEHD
jgi:DNA-binding beta-propeller fold protein YncE